MALHEDLPPARYEAMAWSGAFLITAMIVVVLMSAAFFFRVENSTNLVSTNTPPVKASEGPLKPSQ